MKYSLSTVLDYLTKCHIYSSYPQVILTEILTVCSYNLSHNQTVYGLIHSLQCNCLLCVHRSRRDDTTGGSDGGHDSDPSPPRRQAGDNYDGDSDVSPPRRRPHERQVQSSDDASSRRREERRGHKLQTTPVTSNSKSNEGTTDHSSRRKR